ncbi:hypothetical protein SAMN05421594_4613 [Chryseobacterium oleae]|uniref:Uncharacterized protein n=1 Tax=Chryseobacterium oleae TaxID=491207 RepID=A0A1I5CR29_CHROL|nr:hypothetical protein SAMN05421594_4613 [Chryseobacterium oleae]
MGNKGYRNGLECRNSGQKKTCSDYLTTICVFYPQSFYLFSFFTIFKIEIYEKLIQKKVATLHKHLNFRFRSYY